MQEPPVQLSLPLPLPGDRAPAVREQARAQPKREQTRAQPSSPASARARTGKQARGKMAYLGGKAAEDRVATDYARRGHKLAARRWRGSRGELDIVTRDGDQVVVVEVKQARDFARAMTHLTPAQISRIYGAAAEFVAGEPNGQLTDLRLDIALVDAMGRIEIHENFWA